MVELSKVLSWVSLFGSGLTLFDSGFSATIGILIKFYASHLIDLSASSSLCDNIGTTTAIIKPLGVNIAAKRGGAHVAFNVIGTIIWSQSSLFRLHSLIQWFETTLHLSPEMTSLCSRTFITNTILFPSLELAYL